MKPLIKAIPSKTFEHRGQVYKVYSLVSVHISRKGQCILTANITGKLKQTTGMTQTKLQDSVDRINGFVEQHWKGDRFTSMVLPVSGSVYTHLDKGRYSRVLSGINVKEIGTNAWKNNQFYLGADGTLTEAEIEKGHTKHVEQCTQLAHEYNDWLAEKHKTFRDIVEAQISMRDKAWDKVTSVKIAEAVSK